MNKIFADTAGWANYFVRTEPFHEKANALMKEWYLNEFTIVTTNYVLTELIALFTSPLKIPRIKQIQAIETIRKSIWVDVVHISPALDEESWILLKERQDKTWSLVDCSSMVIMKHFAITESFTTDYHFEQAGFKRSLK